MPYENFATALPDPSPSRSALDSYGEKSAWCLSRNPVNPCRNLGSSYRLKVTLPAHSSPARKSLGSTSETCVTRQDARVSSTSAELNTRSIYVARGAEVENNWLENRANRCYKAGSSPEDGAGHYAFQRLRQKWFTPRIRPKFKFVRRRILCHWIVFCPWN